ncbi:MAG: fibronectin type III domain-containing protein, partial [Treponema sp.]|nr:fibronectin type III domain-containing protein [Treponema sp.]
MSKEQLTNKNNIVFYSQSASWQYYVFLFLFTIFCPLLFFSCSLEGDMNEQRKKGNISNPSIAAPGLPIVNPADSLLTVNWTAVEEAEIYEVFISTSQNPPSKSQKTVSSTTTVLDGLMNKTVYYVWIKAKNEIHSSDFSPRGRGIPWPVNEIPAVPERPIIIQGVNQLTVNWEKSGGAVFYEVYINTSTSRPSAPEITTDKTSAIINNLNNNTIYYLWVRAVNSAGKSNYSPLEAGTPKIPTVAPTAPAKPVLNAGSRSLTASWDAVEYASAYEVWTGTTNDSGKAQKWGSDISGGVTETVISGLTNDTTYYVWIKAKNLVGTSGFSPSANARSSAYAVEPVTPGMPAVIPGFGSLEINWQETEGALSYELWTGITNNTESAKKHGADIQGKSITLTGLVNETTYYIWIKAKNNTGASGFSPMASGTPSAFAITPSSPQTAPTVIEGNGQLSINW